MDKPVKHPRRRFAAARRLLRLALSPADWPAAWREAWELVRLTGNRFVEDRCLQSAGALTYTALLALVPLTTIVVGILSAFPAFQGMQDQVRDLVVGNLVPQVGEAVADHLEGFVQNTGRLTAAGAVGLVVTAILLLATIESAFNAIWRVQAERPLMIRLLSFWAVLTLTPILVVASISMTAQFVQEAGLDARPGIWHLVFVALPLAFEVAAFTLIYRIIPNRPVAWLDALIGGAVAMVLFEAGKAGFTWYLTSFPVYQTIYGALATIPSFLLWLYFTWAVVLIGAVIAASLPEWRAGKALRRGGGRFTPAQQLGLAVAVLAALAGAARRGETLRQRDLDRRLPVSGLLLEGLLERMQMHGFVERTQRERWVLARDLAAASLQDLADALDLGLSGAAGAEGGPWPGAVIAALRRAEDGQHAALAVPLAELVGPAAP